jgi:hypothetical protein
VLSFLNPVVAADATGVGSGIGSLCCIQKRRLLATMITGTLRRKRSSS